MSTEGRHVNAVRAADLESARFVRLLTRPDGDALAASGVIARALADQETPFQVSVIRTIGERTTHATNAADQTADLTIAIGAADGDVSQIASSDRPITVEACELVREVGATPDPVLALAGIVAAGVDPGAGETELLRERALEQGAIERRSGVAIPTADPVDGLAHSTRVQAAWSGDLEATRKALEGVISPDGDLERPDEETRRAIGSLVAIDAVGATNAVDSAASSISQVLHPYAATDAVFETIGGYADVLEATARIEPGTGVALAIGHDAREPALDAWREHGRRTHAALDSASTKRYDGLYVVSIDDGPVVETAARLTAAYTSPEPIVAAIGDGAVGIEIRAGAGSQSTSLGPILEAIARDLEAEGIGCGYDATQRRGYLTYDLDVDDSTIIAAIRGQT